MRVLRLSSIPIVAAAMLFAVACGNSTTSPTTVTSVAVTGTAPTVGGTSQFKATATMSDGSTQDVTSLATWASSDNAVVTVSATGAVLGVADGNAVITATYQSVAGSDQLSLTN